MFSIYFVFSQQRLSQWPLRKQIIIMKFYNREKEVAELKRVQELAFTQNSRMIVVTGRRRIGKTSLIKEALKGTPTRGKHRRQPRRQSVCARIVRNRKI